MNDAAKNFGAMQAHLCSILAHHVVCVGSLLKLPFAGHMEQLILEGANARWRKKGSFQWFERREMSTEMATHLRPSLPDPLMRVEGYDGLYCKRDFRGTIWQAHELAQPDPHDIGNFKKFRKFRACRRRGPLPSKVAKGGTIRYEDPCMYCQRHSQCLTLNLCFRLKVSDFLPRSPTEYQETTMPTFRDQVKALIPVSDLADIALHTQPMQSPEVATVDPVGNNFCRKYFGLFGLPNPPTSPNDFAFLNSAPMCLIDRDLSRRSHRVVLHSTESGAKILSLLHQGDQYVNTGEDHSYPPGILVGDEPELVRLLGKPSCLISVEVYC